MRGGRSGKGSLEVTVTVAAAGDTPFGRGENDGYMDGRQGEWVERDRQ